MNTAPTTPLGTPARTCWRPVAAAITTGVFGFFFVLYVGVWSTYLPERTAPEAVVDAWDALWSYPSRKIRASRDGADMKHRVAALPDGVSHLHLDIAPQHFRALKQKQEQALRDGILVAEDGDEVPGRLVVDDEEVFKVNLRLKGDWVDHLAGSKFSLRVEVRGGKALFGMRRFSVQQDLVRGGHAEGLMLHHMRDHDVLAPRTRYVFLTINAETPGIMVLEEHMGKELLESQGRRESVIMALDEDPMWRQRRLNREMGTTPVALRGPPTANILNRTQFSAYTLPLRVFQESRVWETPHLRTFHQQALGMMRGYLEGSIDADSVFDMEILGRYFAILNVWNATHGLIPHNLRFYYNPVSRLFEPIAFDNDVPFDRFADQRDAVHLGSFHGASASQAFIDSYAATLNAVAADAADGVLQNKVRLWDREFRSALISEYPQVRAYQVDQLVRRIEYLRANVPVRDPGARRYRPVMSHPLADRAQLDSFAHAYWIQQGPGAYLELHNVLPIPLRIERLWFRPRSSERRIELRLTDAQRVVGPAAGSATRTRLPVPEGPVAAEGDYQVQLRVPDLGASRVVTARRYYPELPEVPYQPPGEEEFLARHGFIAARGHEFVIDPGEYRVDDDLVVPVGRSLRLSAGVTLRFGEGVRLVLRSALQVDGTAEAPVVLAPAESSWGGLIVIDAPERSRIRGLELRGVRYPEQDEWGLTGAVTFYESDVDIAGSTFQYCRTEDALNIIRGNLRVSHTTFADHESDALDIDFGNGIIVDSHFTAIGGDAVDISGSDIEARDLRISSAGDKAVSVGERSRFNGQRVTVRDAGFGIAAKDGSFARLADSRLSAVRQAAFAAYVKKPEYGAAQLIASGNHVSEAAEVAVAVNPSTIVLNGDIVPPARQVGKRLAGTLGRFAAESTP